MVTSWKCSSASSSRVVGMGLPHIVVILIVSQACLLLPAASGTRFMRAPAQDNGRGRNVLEGVADVKSHVKVERVLNETADAHELVSLLFLSTNFFIFRCQFQNQSTLVESSCLCKEVTTEL